MISETMLELVENFANTCNDFADEDQAGAARYTLEDRIGLLEQDSKRYWWLVEQSKTSPVMLVYGDNMHNFIDEAIKQQGIPLVVIPDA